MGRHRHQGAYWELGGTLDNSDALRLHILRETVLKRIRFGVKYDKQKDAYVIVIANLRRKRVTFIEINRDGVHFRLVRRNGPKMLMREQSFAGK